MTVLSLDWSEDFAIAMDERDPLRNYRRRFFFLAHPAGEDCVYLCGHSLGLEPKTARGIHPAGTKRLGRTRRGGTLSSANAWMPYHRLLTDQTADSWEPSPSK